MAPSESSMKKVRERKNRPLSLGPIGSGDTEGWENVLKYKFEDPDYEDEQTRIEAEEARIEGEEELRKQNARFKEYYKAEEEFLKSKDYKPTKEEWDEFDKTWWNKEKYQKAEEEEDYRSKETQQKDPSSYKILGVTENASLNEIKKKFRITNFCELVDISIIF